MLSNLVVEKEILDVSPLKWLWLVNRRMPCGEQGWLTKVLFRFIEMTKGNLSQSVNVFSFKKIIYLIIFLVALVLCCCSRAFSSCGQQGLLIAVTSLVAEHKV